MCAVLAHYDIEAGRGTSFRIHCPFHEDDRPSCSVNPGAKVFNCFACGEQGNVLDFIAGMEGLDPKAEFRAVLETAIEIIGHNPTPQKSARKKNPNIAKRTVAGKAAGDNSESNAASKVHGEDVDLYPDESGGNESAADLIAPKKGKKRAVSPKLHEPDGSLHLEPNRVLEAPAFPLKLQSKHTWLDAQLKRIGVSRSVAAEFGIGFESRSNALMANRVCFPIQNAAGELVAYSGRWASDEADQQGRFFTENGREQPRYRLPKGFQKQLETVVLVEGYWSVLRLQAMTIPSVALMGLSISDAQIRLLSEGGIRSVIVILDGDDEGQAAMQTMVPRLASHFFTRSIRLPQGNKPDDVDQSVLNEVKAHLVQEQGIDAMDKSDGRRDSKSLKKAKSQSTVRRKPSNKSKKTRSKDTQVLKPNQRSKTDQGCSNQGYALPPSSATASFGWTGMG
jgi:DNA primase